MIEIRNVTKKFGPKVAVDDENIIIDSGQITGFIGPNGAGKTTTINMITGVLDPDQGEILINGKNILSQPLEAKKQFVLIPDTPDIFLQLTGREYINFLADIYEVDTQVRKERIEDLVVQFDMASDIDARMASYSHGMRQKTLIIAALVCDPPVWILDEPMTGLDPSASFLLKQKMKEHAAKGNTVFFSTHVLEVAEKLCEQIIMIHAGKIIYQGTLEQLRDRYPGLSLEEIFLEVNRDE
ncbi:ABC transporter ATP-binding protein [Ileibacterium valens]|uniref:ABC transporter n=1 Tax=Ileibacterium valens TaxID=1862668 RepID=A0A1U7NDP7_9FIRM|nr:ABC transporter ATP-binding protein [Ileibacterium valens]OLU37477.1 ABC transporter [Ileibacterium valens]OLU39267.1 ABC transporter [Erysipelotrichaceae bacterium NYU-BL-E8]OLU42304.1 ABC transporter [Erysipelotrichaceae bacterium NYU-BL-F16]